MELIGKPGWRCAPLARKLIPETRLVWGLRGPQSTQEKGLQIREPMQPNNSGVPEEVGTAQLLSKSKSVSQSGGLLLG